MKNILLFLSSLILILVAEHTWGRDGAVGGLHLHEGPITAKRIHWRGLDATDATATIENRGDQLLIRNAVGSMYGGSLKGNFRIAKGGHFTDFRLVFRDLHLEQFPKNLLLGMVQSGNMNGELTFSSTYEPRVGAPPKKTMSGEGEFEITEGDLGSLGFIVAIQDIIDLPLRKERKITAANLKFDIERSGIHFRKIELIGNDVELYGKGRLYYDGRLDLRFRIKAKNKLLEAIPLLGPVVSSILTETGTLLPIWVQGVIGEPKVSVVRSRDESIREPRKGLDNESKSDPQKPE